MVWIIFLTFLTKMVGLKFSDFFWKFLRSENFCWKDQAQGVLEINGFNHPALLHDIASRAVLHLTLFGYLTTSQLIDKCMFLLIISWYSFKFSWSTISQRVLPACSNFPFVVIWLFQSSFVVWGLSILIEFVCFHESK
jgi:hypothetical protein